MEWITTTTVLDRLLNTDEGAWDQLANRFRKPVVCFAERLGLSPWDAEDLAQETLLVFVRTLREGRYDRKRGRLGSWLLGIAHRLILRARKRLARKGEELPREGPGSEGEIPDPEAQQIWEEVWDREILDLCLQRVREEVQPRTWKAFELTALEEKPAASAGGELGMSANAVFLARHRVLKRLREVRAAVEGVD